MNESATLVAVVAQAGAMDAAAVVAVGALVTALSQVTKRIIPGDIDEWGPLISVCWAIVGTGLWVISQPHFEPRLTDAFPIAVGLAGIMLAAIGNYEISNMTTKTLSLGARREVREARERGEDVTPPELDAVRVPAGGREVVVPVADPLGGSRGEAIEGIIDRAEADRASRTTRGIRG